MAPKLNLRSAQSCEWDILSLGEVMLRFDPGEDRISSARTYRVWEGGGEYNVARGLRRCFRQRAAIATALVDNPIGRLVEDCMLQGGVDVSHVQWTPDDGVGNTRNGLYFLERGFGVRSALACMDRAHTAVSRLSPGAFDWHHIFGTLGVRVFHTGGIFCALSDGTRALAEEAMRAAREHGTIVSYDCNYRPSLWKAQGGRSAAIATNRRLLSFVDVLFGHDGDLALELSERSHRPPSHSLDTYKAMASEMFTQHPSLSLIATPTRQSLSASQNHWGGFAASRSEVVDAPDFRSLEILDRVGGGDAFAAGLLYGVLIGETLSWALHCGIAHGALTMSTPGDNSFATLSEVTHLMRGGSLISQR